MKSSILALPTGSGISPKPAIIRGPTFPQSNVAALNERMQKNFQTTPQFEDVKVSEEERQSPFSAPFKVNVTLLMKEAKASFVSSSFHKTKKAAKEDAAAQALAYLDSLSASTGSYVSPVQARSVVRALR